MTVITRLPIEIQRHIYEYDPTYHIIFNSVLKNVIPSKNHAMNNYINEYYSRSLKDCDVKQIINNNYTITLPDEREIELLVLTEPEMIEVARYRISQSLSTFDYEFIENYLINHISEDMYNVFQESDDFIFLLENNVNLNALTKDAIEMFGTSQFMIHMYGDEFKYNIDGKIIYIYYF